MKKPWMIKRAIEKCIKPIIYIIMTIIRLWFKIFWKCFVSMSKPWIIKRVIEKCIKPSVYIIMIIIRIWPKVFLKCFVSIRRLTPRFVSKHFENFAFWIINFCRRFILNMRNFYRLSVHQNKLIKSTSFIQIVLKKIFSFEKYFWKFWFPRVWNLKRFENLYLHCMGLIHILLILTWRNPLSKGLFGLVWR